MRTKSEIIEVINEMESGKVLLLPGGYGLNEGFHTGLYYALGYSIERAIELTREGRLKAIEKIRKEIRQYEVKENKK